MTAEKRIDRLGNEILATPNHDCPACQAKRRHTNEERAQYHPLAGTGVVVPLKWS